MTTFSHNLGLANGQNIGLFGNRALSCRAQELVLKDNYGPIVADGGDGQAFRVVGGAGNHDLQPRDVGYDGIERL